MSLAAGVKLASVVCGGQAIVIRPPSQDGVLSCGGAPMAPASGGVAADAVTQLGEAQTGHGLVGKRYVDETAGLEVLCTKSCKGAFAFEGRPLTLKEAKALPASD